MDDTDQVRSSRELLVWQKGTELAQVVFSPTQDPLIGRIRELQTMLDALHSKLTTSH